MKSKKWLALLLACALAMSVFALAGCAKEEPVAEPVADEPMYTLVTPGKLTVGSDTAYPPFESINAAGEVEGFDVDLIAEVAKELGVEFEFKTYNFDALIIGVQTGSEFDIIGSAMTIKPDRAEQIDFSDPYFDAGQSLAVRNDSTFASLDDLAGKKIGVQSGTTGEEFAKENAPADATIVPFENILQAFQALQNGDVDGVVNDKPVTDNIVADPAREVKVVGGLMGAEQYGFGVSKDNPELTKAINEALAKIRADGRYEALLVKWFSS
jgi:polar amino acid transport system substrate-binding protein